MKISDFKRLLFAVLVCPFVACEGLEFLGTVEYQRESTNQIIPYRDGVLVELHGAAVDRIRYVEFGSSLAKEMEVDGIWDLMDAGKGAKTTLFFGLNKEPYRFVLIEEGAQKKQHIVNLPIAFQAQLDPPQPEALWIKNRPNLIRSTHRAAALMGDSIWWLDEKWKKEKLPKVPKFHEEFEINLWEETSFYLDGTTLYVGWNQGEWGGLLVSTDLKAKVPKWDRLSGKAWGDASGIPGDSSVIAIVPSLSGEIWVSNGGGDYYWRGLHCRDANGRWRTLINGKFPEDRGSIKIPQFSDIGDIAFDKDGELLILLPEVGVFQLGEKSLLPLFEYNFCSHTFDRGDYHVGGRPNSLGMSKDGTLFVSSIAYGVLAFQKKEGTWHGHQIKLDKEDE